MVLIRRELIGGWWEICYNVTDISPIKPWKVSPNMGLNGFYILGEVAETNMNAAVIYLICYMGSLVWLAFAMKWGTKPRLEAMTSNIDFLSNISTGRDILIMDFPANRLVLSCLIIIFSISFWAANASESQNMYWSSSNRHLFPWMRNYLLFPV